MNHDVAIVGAGPVGLCMARALALQGLAVALVERQPQAALADPALHRLLALLDALRTGRARERALAAEFMHAALTTAPEAADAGE